MNIRKKIKNKKYDIDNNINGDYMNYLFKINFMEVGEVVIRSLFSLISLFFVTKMLGKKQVSQLSLFDYVIGMSIGNFAAEISINTDLPYINGIVSVFVFGIVAYLISYLTLKSITLRRFFMGTPTILIENGKIIYNNLNKVKIDINDLLEECRNKDYFDISEIDYAVMETNGEISILAKNTYLSVTKKDMNLKDTKQGLVSNIIIDGKIMKENLMMMNKDDKWLYKELKLKGCNDINDIILATLDVNEKINIYKKEFKDSTHNVLE